MSRLVLIFLLFCSYAFASDVKHPKQQKWSFDGIFGRFDRSAIQRGFQVYKEVCSACHSVKRIAFRNLIEVGFSEAEVKSLANEYQIDDINDEGDPIKRNGKIFDYLPKPYVNDNQAKAANGGAIPPDLSLIIKARHNGANYVYSILTGYAEPKPDHVEVLQGTYYNPYFPGHQIKMTAPLISNGQVSYQDGTEASVEQMAMDVINFLHWASEPEMEKRKSMGLKVIAFLILMTMVFYIAMKQVWKDVD